jgi:hypothetical protein
VLCGKTTNTHLIVFALTRPALEPTIYRTWGKHANHYTTDVVNIFDFERFRKRLFQKLSLFKVKFLGANVLFLSGILVRSFSICNWIPVELKYPLVPIHKVSKYCLLKLVKIQCSSHVISLSEYIANSPWHWGSYGSIWTGPYTAIWPEVTWTICYIITNFNRQYLETLWIGTKVYFNSTGIQLHIEKDRTNIPERKRTFAPRNLTLNSDRPVVIYL